LLHVVCVWQRKFPTERLSVNHDESSELMNQRKKWDELWQANAVIEGYYFDAHFPLPIDSTKFDCKSEEIPQIQVSDILAGAAADYYKNLWHEDSFKTTHGVDLITHPDLMKIHGGGIYFDLLAASIMQNLRDTTKNSKLL
jgi:hypothetical protein